MADSDALDPKASPTSQTPVVGIKKVNNWPLILVFIGVGAFLLIMMLVGMDRAEQQQQRIDAGSQPAERFASDTSAQAEAVIAGRETGYIPPSEDDTVTETDVVTTEEALPPEQQVDPEIRAMQNSLPNSQSGQSELPQRPTGQDSRRLELARQIEQQKFRTFQDAVSSRTAITVSTNNTSGGGSSFGNLASSRSGQLQQLEQLSQLSQELEFTKNALASDPTALYQQTLSQLQNSGLVEQISSGFAPNGSQTPSFSTGANSGQMGDSLSQFDGTKDRWDLNESPDAPKGSYMLHAGFVVPAIMVTGINSDLEGQVIGQVSQNVYDSVTGEYLLIPQGTRAVGRYNSNVMFGQDAVFVAWQRLIFPDGKTMDIGSMQGADSAGLSGFRDKVNHHYLRIFGSALMMSVITAGVEISQNNDDDQFTERSALNEALGQQLGQAAAQLIMRNLNIAPTVEIRSGYRYNIMVSKDMVFDRPYQSYDY